MSFDMIHDDDESHGECRAEITSLAQRVAVLEIAIRTHRDQKADDRCIEDDDRLYEALGDGIKCDRRVGNRAEMLENCARFINNRCKGGGWPSYVELELKLVEAHESMEMYKTLHRHALDCVDRVFQNCTENPHPILPGFLRLGTDKFKGVIKLAEAYAQLIDAWAFCERLGTCPYKSHDSTGPFWFCQSARGKTALEAVLNAMKMEEAK